MLHFYQSQVESVQNCPDQGKHVSQENHTVSEMLKAKIGTAGHLLMGGYSSEEESGQRCTLCSLCRHTTFNLLDNLTHIKHRKYSLC